MRRSDDFEFKGSIFTELQTQEQATQLLENKELKVEEETLILMKRFVSFLFKNIKTCLENYSHKETKQNVFNLSREKEKNLTFGSSKQNDEEMNLKIKSDKEVILCY